jgi:hypothetical protein
VNGKAKKLFVRQLERLGAGHFAVGTLLDLAKLK